MIGYTEIRGEENSKKVFHPANLTNVRHVAATNSQPIALPHFNIQL